MGGDSAMEGESIDSPEDLLAEARERTLAVVDGLSESDVDRMIDPIMSPIAWDLGHIAAFEDLWLVHNATGTPLLREELADVYDASATPRRERPDLPWLRSDTARAYLEQVRERSLEALYGPNPPSGEIVDLVLRHEHQHSETILQTVQLGRVEWEPTLPEPPEETTPGEAAGGGLDFLETEGGTFEMGAGPEGFAYDNERPRHEVTVDPFMIGRTPVLNGEWQEFIDEGGYERKELWSDGGLDWLEESGVRAPDSWDEEGEWRAGRLEPLDPMRPVVHICLHEAEAFARMHDARLPTEVEWEFAATELADHSIEANLDTLAGGTRRLAPGDGPLGMVGDVWEWTASDFDPYPDFRWHPYREYSEPHFGPEHRVLRGSSWATRERVATPTFRNWDLPVRRQIFAGVRLARDRE
ncbi:MAG: SUMF1/EgtB/PvdO family nonheme iron enzyme [Solirubrobacterales bacterium]